MKEQIYTINEVSNSVATRAATTDAVTRGSVCPKCEREAEAILMTFEKIAEIASELENSNEKIADKNEQNKRLTACSSCEALRGGVLCSWCGCYVLLRARALNARCPYPKNDKWKN
ncbi:MAG: hypothetical protein GX297_08830 [Treponema sp.]|jgi:hypothetical protein|nr:hypothetical protein [Treponema sp.]